LDQPTVLFVASIIKSLELLRSCGIYRLPENVVLAANFPPLRRQEPTLKIWWRLGVEPWIKERRKRIYESALGGGLFADLLSRKGVKSEAVFISQLLSDCKRALESLAEPVAENSPNSP
jgi:hypothetical protein